jgi:hypothetical protein
VKIIESDQPQGSNRERILNLCDGPIFERAARYPHMIVKGH